MIARDHSTSEFEASKHSVNGLERVAGWYFPPIIRRVLPTAVRDALREMRGRILSYYATCYLPRNKDFEQSLEDAQASASLSIIVPVHDASEVTKRCLMSLQKYAPKAEIILVDDASKLKETQRILEDFSSRNDWKLIRNPERLGHSAACGAGASLATRPYLCLLNSDTVVTPWCWRLLTQVFEEDATIGIAGPSTSNAATLQVSPLMGFARYSLNDSQICEYAKCLLLESMAPIIKDLLWVSGFAFFIRRSLWEHLDGFDINLPDYGNEFELCIRALGAGHRVVWVCNAYIHHLGSVSYKKAIGVESTLARNRNFHDYIKQKHAHSSCFTER